MTDEELLTLLREKYPALYARLYWDSWLQTERPVRGELSDLRALMAAQWEEMPKAFADKLGLREGDSYEYASFLDHMDDAHRKLVEIAAKRSADLRGPE